MEDKLATQLFAIRHVLINNCGKMLDGDTIDAIINEIEDEIVNDKYIMVENEKIFEPMPVIEFYEAQLNGTQKEFGNLAWRPLVPEWFSQHIGEDFKDGMHVKNSFKRFYMAKATAKQ